MINGVSYFRYRTVLYHPYYSMGKVFKLSSDVKQGLSSYFKPPLDIQDAYRHWQYWCKLFALCHGIKLIVIGLKMPVAREYFCKGFAHHSHVTPLGLRVFLALVFMAESFHDPVLYIRLRHEIDCIKGPLKVHGMCMYCRRLHIVRTSAQGMRLGVSPQRFVCKGYTNAAARAIAAFIRMHDVLQSLPVSSSIATYAANQKIVLRSMSSERVPQLTTPGIRSYNREWTFRVYALAQARHLGIMRLYVSAEDRVRDLPGPDTIGIKGLFGKENCIQDVIIGYGIRVRPEFICMAACISKGRASSKSSAAVYARVSSGRCEACARRHYSVHYCRIVRGHTA